MARFTLTDRFENVISAVIEGENFKSFPLLARMNFLKADVLQTYDVENGKATNFKTKVLGDGVGYESEITFINNGDITDSAIQRATMKITQDIYTQIEKDILTEALKTTGDYEQGANDFLLMKDNDLVPRAVPQYETRMMDDLLLEQVLINPDTGIIIGNIAPEFEIVMDMATNEVKVYGVVRVLYTFSGKGFIKVVKGENKPKPVPVESVTVSQKTMSLSIGESKQLTATVLPENADDKTVTWTSSDDTKATVDGTGKVTAVAEGTAKITATAGGKTATCEVTVKPASK